MRYIIVFVRGSIFSSVLIRCGIAVVYLPRSGKDMVILRSQNKITDVLMILVWACPFKLCSGCSPFLSLSNINCDSKNTDKQIILNNHFFHVKNIILALAIRK